MTLTFEHLTDEELALLTDDELVAYVEILEQLEDIWTLNPRQEYADQLADTVDELMFGGAAGGGKSELDLWHANKWSKKVPRHRTLILRSSFPELRRTLIFRSLTRFTEADTRCGPTNAPAQYKVGDKEWHYGNGSVIEFGYCENPEDVRQYLSAEYDLIIIDESTDFTWDMIELLRSRLRTSRKKRALGCKPHLLLSTNPGGKGHADHKKRFVIATSYGQHVATMLDDPDDPSTERRVAFVVSKVDDTPQLDPAYKRNLQALSDPVKRAQYLEGSWDTFEGQYFTEFDRGVHVIPWFEIPKEWTRVRSVDFGIANPFCCLWLAYDPDGWAYAYRELYHVGLTGTEQAKLVVNASKYADGKKEHIGYSVGDPSGWAKQGTGTSFYMQYRDAGIVLRKAMNARVDGWSRVRDYLRGTKDPKDLHFGQGLRILAGTCPNLVRTLPELIHDKNNPEDLDSDGEDHSADALRYNLMSRPRLPKRPHDSSRHMGELLAGEEIEDVLKERERARRNHPILGRI